MNVRETIATFHRNTLENCRLSIAEENFTFAVDVQCGSIAADASFSLKKIVQSFYLPFDATQEQSVAELLGQLHYGYAVANAIESAATVYVRGRGNAHNAAGMLEFVGAGMFRLKYSIEVALPSRMSMPFHFDFLTALLPMDLDCRIVTRFIGAAVRDVQ